MSKPGVSSDALRRDLVVAALALCIGLAAGRSCKRDTRLSSSGRSLELNSGHADRRVAKAQARLSEHPEDLEALSELAIANFLKGPESYVEGINALEKARSLGSTDEALFFYAGAMYDALGLRDYAANEFNRYLRHHPDEYEAQVRLANVLYHDKKYDEAKTLYRKALDSWPKDPTVWFNFAVVCTEKGDTAEAEKALDHVRRLAGNLPKGGLFLEGEIARVKRSDGAAIERYQQELALYPNYIPALEALEAMQKRKGFVKDARETHKRLLDARKELNPPPASSAMSVVSSSVSSEIVSSASSSSSSVAPVRVQKRRKAVVEPPLSSSALSSVEMSSSSSAASISSSSSVLPASPESSSSQSSSSF